MGDKQAHLDGLVQQVLTDHGVPNAAAVYVRDGGATVLTWVKGVRDTTPGANPGANTVSKSDYWNVGSISKPLTGFFVAALVKLGVLQWNTTLGQVFPEFGSAAFRKQTGIRDTYLTATVAQLMGHTWPLDGQYYFDLNVMDTSIRETDPFRYPFDLTLKKEWENIRAIRHLRYLYAILSIKDEPFVLDGTKNLHRENTRPNEDSDTATIVAAMAERKTGKAFETLFDEVKSSLGFDIRRYGLTNGMQLHSWDAAAGKYVKIAVAHRTRRTPTFHPKFIIGDMSLSVGGMADYLSYNLKPPANVPKVDIAGYQSPIANCTHGGLYKSGSTLSHDGSTGVSGADLHINPAGGYGYAVMFNSGDVDSRRRPMPSEALSHQCTPTGPASEPRPSAIALHAPHLG